jgi:hypothetical protein
MISPLGEKSLLRLVKFHRSRTVLVVVSNVIDPSAYGIATHQPSFEALQQFGRHTQILHTRIEPQVVAVGIKNDGHAVVNG